MAKKEMMDLGSILVQSALEVVTIKKLSILETVNAHGWMELVFLSGKTLTAEDSLRYQDSPIQVQTKEGDVVFSGLCKTIGLKTGNEYTEVQVLAYTYSILTDQEKKNVTFQAEAKTLQQVLDQGIGSKGLVAVDEDLPIGEMLSQEQETDWAFGRRVANQYGKQLFVNGKAKGCQIHVGARPFSVKELGIAEPISRNRDVDKVRLLKGNDLPSASVFEFEETVLQVYDLSIGAGDALSYQGRQQTVVKREIYSLQGAVLNRITLANEEGLAPDRGSATGSLEEAETAGALPKAPNPLAENKKKTGRNSILTGTVVEIEGTNVQVDFGTPGDRPRWIPYACASSNYLYAMPDKGDKVFVYYETGDREKLVCLGSKHVNQSPDFAHYKDKMLTANNRMLKFSGKDVHLIGNREEYDGRGGNQAKIVFNEERGIEITSTQDIVLETTEGGSITLQAVRDSFSGMEKIRNSFAEKYQKGETKYIAAGGNAQFDALGHLAGVEWENLKESIENNLLSFMEIKNTLQELAGRIGGAMESGEQEIEEAPPEFTDGKAMMMALERLVIQVGNNYVSFGDGMIQIKANAYLQLGTDRTIAYAHLEDANYTWRDMVLDLTQCALDIVGVLPIPGVSSAANLISAGISLVKGDYIEAAMSAGQAALSLIPGANTATAPAAVTKIAAKMNKAAKRIGPLIDFCTTLISGVDDLNTFLSTSISVYDVGAALFSGEFDLNDPNILQDVSELIQEFTDSKTKGDNEGKKNKDSGDGRKTRGEREQERSGNKDNKQRDIKKEGDTSEPKKQNSPRLEEKTDIRCKNGEPIDMVTGSYLIEQCDFVLNDITGRVMVERTYESLLCEADSPVGKGWTLNLFSKAMVYDDRVEILLPDNHTETFLKTPKGYRNRRGGSKRLTLTEQERGFCLVEASHARTYQYDKGGKLLWMADRNGNRTRYQYQGNTLEKICFASGQYLSLTWQGKKLISLEDCIGRKVTYHYEGELLTQVEMVNGGMETYGYDTEGRVVEITDANGVTYVHNEYDHKHRVIRQRLCTGQEYVLFYEEDNRTNTYLEVEKQNTLRYVYNRKRQLIRTEYEDGTISQLGYDEWENRVWEKNRLGHEVHRSYDEFGRLLEEKQPGGLVRSFRYDGHGNCVEKWDNTGLCSQYTYDERGNLLTEVQQISPSVTRQMIYEYDAHGRITAFTDGNGNRECYYFETPFFEATCFITAEGNTYHHELDQAGRLVALTDMDGTSTYAYNHFDLLCRETNPLGHTTKYYYDGVLDLVKIVRPGGDKEQGGQERAETFVYNAFHHLLCRVDETGAVFATPRDGEGNLLKEIHPNTYEEERKDGEGIQYVYDKDNRPWLIQFPEGGEERRWYDAEGNLTKVSRPEQYEASTDTGEGDQYTYDAMNRPVQVMGPDGRIKKRYVYDLHGNLCKEIDPAGMSTGESDEECIGTLYTYNYAGWLLEKRTPVREKEGQVFYGLERYAYDQAGNRIQEKRYLEEQSLTSAGGRVLTISYAYDKDNRLVEVKDSTGALLTYQYDGKNRKTLERRKINEESVQLFQYRYDAGGRLTQVIKGADQGAVEKAGYRCTTTTMPGETIPVSFFPLRHRSCGSMTG